MKYCLGTVQFGLDYGIQGGKHPNREKVGQMLDYAISHGITTFDTASAYGEAESVLGWYIRDRKKENSPLNIVSKLRPDAFNGQQKEEWKDIVEKNVKESLERIGVSKFKAYLFHNAAYIFDPHAVEALYTAVDKGYSEMIGVSVYSPDEAMKALEYSLIKSIQIPYNVFDRRLDNCHFFEKAKENGVTVYARSSLLQGLVMMDPDALPEKVTFARPYLCRFLEICKKYGMPPLNAAIGYAASKKGIDYIVFGVDNIKQLEEYISLESQKISDEMIKEFDETFNTVEEKLVNPSLWNK